MFVGIHIFLSQVVVLVQVAVDNQRIAFIHALDGLFVAGNDVQHIVRMHESRGTNLVALGQAESGRPIEIAVILCHLEYCVYCVNGMNERRNLSRQLF